MGKRFVPILLGNDAHQLVREQPPPPVQREGRRPAGMKA
jgi:hypothetical protein